MSKWVLTLNCPDRQGIVAAVASLISEHSGNITEARQFESKENGLFFMRVAFSLPSDAQKFRMHFDQVAEHYSMNWSLQPATDVPKVILMLSKFDHCALDLLYRRKIGEINMDVVGVVSNHPDFAVSCPADIPFHHLSVDRDNKGQVEQEIRSIIEKSEAELIVLARYMQILSKEMSDFVAGRCINIHHSFLPGFKGAKPYNQAFDRGVKIIGATAHFVTSDLDEGPIIYQDVERVSHADTPDDLVRRGRDIERRVLARAVSLFLDKRVFLNGNKTVVFEK